MAPPNRIAVVTGTSRGLGRAIADELVQQGVYVAGCDSQTVDVCDVRDVHEFIKRVSHVNGFIDILVNNAGILGPVGNVDDNDLDDWAETLETNLLGPVNLMQACLPIMRAQRAGKIINIAGGGSDKPLARRSAYACSKAALVRLTDTAADELKDTGITVNAVAPGPLDTGMMDEILAAEPDAEKPTPGPASIQRAAKLVTWLASPDSDGLTGRYIAARHDPWPFSQHQIAEIMLRDLYALRRTC